MYKYIILVFGLTITSFYILNNTSQQVLIINDNEDANEKIKLLKNEKLGQSFELILKNKKEILRKPTNDSTYLSDKDYKAINEKLAFEIIDSSITSGEFADKVINEMSDIEKNETKAMLEAEIKNDTVTISWLALRGEVEAQVMLQEKLEAKKNQLEYINRL